MILSVTQRPRARVDLLEQFVYLGEAAGVDLAERYLAAVDATYALLAQQPRMGAAYVSGLPGLGGMRRIPIKGSENYLLFYLPHSGGLDVVRVLHGARDMTTLFEAEEQ